MQLEALIGLIRMSYIPHSARLFIPIWHLGAQHRESS